MWSRIWSLKPESSQTYREWTVLCNILNNLKTVYCNSQLVKSHLMSVTLSHKQSACIAVYGSVCKESECGPVDQILCIYFLVILFGGLFPGLFRVGWRLLSIYIDGIVWEMFHHTASQDSVAAFLDSFWCQTVSAVWVAFPWVWSCYLSGWSTCVHGTLVPGVCLQ